MTPAGHSVPHTFNDSLLRGLPAHRRYGTIGPDVPDFEIPRLISRTTTSSSRSISGPNACRWPCATRHRTPSASSAGSTTTPRARRRSSRTVRTRRPGGVTSGSTTTWSPRILPVSRSSATLRKTSTLLPITYDDMEPGCFSQPERLRDMDDNYTDASMCFPTSRGSAGRPSSKRKDKDFALSACASTTTGWSTSGVPAPGTGDSSRRPSFRCGIRSWRPRRSLGARPKDHTRSRSRSPPTRSVCPAFTVATGTRSCGPVRRPTPSSTCTSALRRNCRPRRRTRRRLSPSR